jgi:putative membrane protein
MKNPKIEKILTQAEVQKIEDNVARAETKTRGEIVPMIVGSSAVGGHIVPTTFLILLAVVLTASLSGFYYHGSSIELLLEAGAVLVIALTISFFVGRSAFALRLLTDDDDLAAEVEQRAEIEFWRSGLHKTDGSTGILLFVSLAEHWAVVLADDSISKKLPPETWTGVIEKLINGIKKKNLSQGFSDAIELCGEILATHFPIRPEDKNELPNKLVIKD